MSSLCDYSDVYVLVKVTVTVAQETTAAPNNATKQVIFKTQALNKLKKKFFRDVSVKCRRTTATC